MEQTQKKEITKAKYKLMTWGTLIGGIVLYCILNSMFMTSGINESQIRLGLWASISSMIIGGGIGLAIAHSFKIKDIGGETKCQ